jgi:hypothetical protein
LDAGGLQSINEFEYLPLPAHELGAGLPTATIVKGHRSQGFELLGLGRDVSRPSPAAIGQDGTFMELAAVAVAVGFATLPPQVVERAGQERCSSEALFQKLRELLLDFEKLRTQEAELLAHEMGPRPICRSLTRYTYRERGMFEVRPKKEEKSQSEW